MSLISTLALLAMPRFGNSNGEECGRAGRQAVYCRAKAGEGGWILGSMPRTSPSNQSGRNKEGGSRQHQRSNRTRLGAPKGEGEGKEGRIRVSHSETWTFQLVT